MEQQPDIRIVEFATGRELSIEEAGSGEYTLASLPRTLYAFGGEYADEQLDAWAEQHGVSDRVAAARELIDAQPEYPAAGVDAQADDAEVERNNRLLDELSAELNIPIGSSELLRIAHERRIFGTVILYGSAGCYGTPRVVRETSCPDLTQWLPNGAQSCQSTGHSTICLFEQPDYKPRRRPYLEFYGAAACFDLARPIRSLLIS